MAELQSKPETAPVPAPVVAEVPSNDAVATEGSEADESKALVVRTEETAVPENKQSWRGSIDRDIALAEVYKAKKLSYVKAWEESEKAKADNRANKHLSAVAAWEDSKMAALEAELKKIEEKLEKKKAEHGEKMKNKMSLVHKKAEEKRARIEAKRGEEILKTGNCCKIPCNRNHSKEDHRLLMIYIFVIWSDVICNSHFICIFTSLVSVQSVSTDCSKEQNFVNPFFFL